MLCPNLVMNIILLKHLYIRKQLFKFIFIIQSQNLIDFIIINIFIIFIDSF